MLHLRAALALLLSRFVRAYHYIRSGTMLLLPLWSAHKCGSPISWQHAGLLRRRVSLVQSMTKRTIKNFKSLSNAVCAKLKQDKKLTTSLKTSSTFSASMSVVPHPPMTRSLTPMRSLKKPRLQAQIITRTTKTTKTIITMICVPT